MGTREKYSYFLEATFYTRIWLLITAVFLLFLILFLFPYTSPTPQPPQENKQDPLISSLPIPTLPVRPPSTTFSSSTLIIKPGDRLIDKLTQAKISYNDALLAINALKPHFDPNSLIPGQFITITTLEHSPHILSKLNIATTPNQQIVLTKAQEGSVNITTSDITYTKKLRKVGGAIHSNLFATCRQLGLPPTLIMELIDAYSYDVDFQRDIQKGDYIEVLFERLYTSEGTYVGDGDILYASLQISGEPITVYLHTLNNKPAEYYTEDGKTVRKSLLRTPINGAHLSSGFGKRKHPILGYTKMHRGLDFAAPQGTPFFAAGDGVITEMKYKGAYGKYIHIQHSSGYASAYAHAHHFARGLEVGQKVKQGQVIAYVGTSGRSTGPHLHFEIIKNKAQVNPAKVKMPPEQQLKGRHLEKFLAYKENIDTLFAALPDDNFTVLALKNPQ